MNDFMVNPMYLTGVHTVKDPLHIHTNAGTCTTKQQGFLGSAPFWLDKKGITNVISLRTLETKHRVTYHSTKHGGIFIVHTPEGEVYFRCCSDMGFPYIDLDDSSQGATMLLQTIQDAMPTIRGNYKVFTKQEITKAQEARDLQAKLGRLSTTELKRLLQQKEKVSHTILHGCPVMMKDYDNANTIFGPSIDRVKGTTMRAKPTRAEAIYVSIPIPREIDHCGRH